MHIFRGVFVWRLGSGDCCQYWWWSRAWRFPLNGPVSLALEVSLVEWRIGRVIRVLAKWRDCCDELARRRDFFARA